jgi:hypothetical protein
VQYHKNRFYPLSCAAKERVVDPPVGGNDRVSKIYERHWRKCSGVLTHPNISVSRRIVDPLRQVAKRVREDKRLTEAMGFKPTAMRNINKKFILPSIGGFVPFL